MIKMSTKATVSDSSSPAIEVRQREVDEHTIVLAIDGELDLATAPALKWSLLDVLEAGYSQLVLDLSGVGFMDSTAIGVLVGIKRQLVAGQRLAIASLQADVLKIFEVTGLDGSFHIASNVEDALSAARHEGHLAAG
jgi:anti-sigma B factor antagonist